MAENREIHADQEGRFTEPVSSERDLEDIEWREGRMVVADDRLVFVSDDGKHALQLANVKDCTVRPDAPAVLPVSSYLTLRSDVGTFLLAPEDLDPLEHGLFAAILDGQKVLVKHPAVKGGVVQETSWCEGRLDYEEGKLAFATAEGQFVTVSLDQVASTGTEKRTVRGAPRPVTTVTHASADTFVETEFTGVGQHMRVLGTLFEEGERRNDADVDLDEREREVLTALYAGISPLDVPTFVDQDADAVEETYDKLIDAGLVQCRRVRREVRLKTRGRVVASEAAGDN